MKKWKNSVGFVLILVVLLLGFHMPVMMSAVEDKRLISQSELVEIEKITVNANEVDITQTLQNFAMVFTDNVQIQVSATEKDELSEQRKEMLLKEKVNLFMQILYKDWLPEFVNFKMSYRMLVDRSNGEIYPIVECVGIDENKQEYMFWLEESTQMVLAFKVPKTDLNWDLEGFRCFAEQIRNYYGFQCYAYEGNENHILEYKNIGGNLLFSKEGKAEIVSVNVYCESNFIWFNLYPGSIVISDAE